jgi:hypothetical protein
MVDHHWQQDVLGLMYMCCQEGTFVERKSMFKFSIGMLMDIKIGMRSISDVPLGLQQDWQDYFDSLRLQLFLQLCCKVYPVH